MGLPLLFCTPHTQNRNNTRGVGRHAPHGWRGRRRCWRAAQAGARSAAAPDSTTLSNCVMVCLMSMGPLSVALYRRTKSPSRVCRSFEANGLPQTRSHQPTEPTKGDCAECAHQSTLLALAYATTSLKIGSTT